MTSKRGLWNLLGTLAAIGTGLGSCTEEVPLGPGKGMPNGTGGGAGDMGGSGTGASGGDGEPGGSSGANSGAMGGGGGDGGGGAGAGGDGGAGAGTGGEGGKGIVCGDVRGLKLWTLGIGPVDYVTLKNPSDCAMNLEGVELEFDDHDDAIPGTELDCTLRLPPHELPAGASVHVRENALPGDIDVLAAKVTPCENQISFNPQRGGATYLCNGECAPDTVIDAVAFVSLWSVRFRDPPALRYGIVFETPPRGVPLLSADGLGGDGGKRIRYQRVATRGVSPEFVSRDWALQARTVFSDFEENSPGYEDYLLTRDPSGLLTEWQFLPAQEATIEPSTDAARSGAYGAVIRHMGDDGTSSALGLPLDAYSMPRDIAYFARVTAPGAGFLELLSEGRQATQVGFEESGLGAIFGNGERSEVPFDLDTWYRIELRDIDWVRAEFDFYVDGTRIGQRLAFAENAAPVDEVRLHNFKGGSIAYFDAIEFWGTTYEYDGGTGGRCGIPGTGGTGGGSGGSTGKGGTGDEDFPDCFMFGLLSSGNCQTLCNMWQGTCCGSPVTGNYADVNECMNDCTSFTDAQYCCRLHYVETGVRDGCAFALGTDTGHTPALCLD
jgi:hypothetical protein